MKQNRLTFWLIGFGCGMIVTGMISAVIGLNISINTQKNISDNVNILKDENTQVSMEINREKPLKENTIDTSLNTETVINNKNNSEVYVTETLDDTIEHTPEFCEVKIPSRVSASMICQILEEHGIVENGQDFLKYIKEQKKQTLLKSGDYTLQIGASYEEILTQLLTS